MTFYQSWPKNFVIYTIWYKLTLGCCFIKIHVINHTPPFPLTYHTNQHHNVAHNRLKY